MIMELWLLSVLILWRYVLKYLQMECYDHDIFFTIIWKKKEAGVCAG